MAKSLHEKLLAMAAELRRVHDNCEDDDFEWDTLAGAAYLLENAAARIKELEGAKNTE